MPSATYRMHQKLSDGSYQAIHVESESGVILRPNGDTVEQTLRSCVLAEDAGDNVPGFVVDADTLGGSTKEEIISTAQAGVDLSNIDAATLGGSTKEQIIAAVPTYTHLTTKQCNYSVDTSSFATKSEIDELEKKIAIGTLGLSTPVLGARIRIGGFDYMIVHITSSIVYAIIEVCPMTTEFGSNATYAGSTIANLCTTWYNDNVPSQWKNEANAFNTEYVGGVMARCFIPTADQANGGWSYFNSNSRRIFTDSSGNAHTWWTSTPNTSSSPGDVLYVTNYGDINYFNFPTAAEGFRPAFAIKRSLFTS